ncbi:MAG: DNA gyrase inhibitor YacG [Planctomycetaceae bacterium]|nr:DNA gyrase inhibitor YacG [Planctomycetaceae bacterium]
MIRRQDCPVCGKGLPDDPAVLKKYSPFCSERCKQVDLFRWAEGRYAIVENVDPIEAELLAQDPDVIVDNGQGS